MLMVDLLLLGWNHAEGAGLGIRDRAAVGGRGRGNMVISARCCAARARALVLKSLLPSKMILWCGGLTAWLFHSRIYPKIAGDR